MHIILSIISQKNPEFLPVATSLIIKLRNTLDENNSGFLAIALWIIIKAVGVNYENRNLIEFVNKSIEEHLAGHPVLTCILEKKSFEKIMQNQFSVFSKNFVPVNAKLTKNMFEIEEIFPDGRRSECKEIENDEDFIGKNNSDTEFSSVSSYDIQERVIDLQDIKMDFASNDYDKLIVSQEEYDKKLLGQISQLSSNL